MPPAGVRGVSPFLNVINPWRPTVHLADKTGQKDLCEEYITALSVQFHEGKTIF